MEFVIKDQFLKKEIFQCGFCPTCHCNIGSLVTILLLCPLLVFFLPSGSLKVQRPDAPSLPMWRGASTFPTWLLLLVHCTVNADNKTEASSSMPLSFFFSCDCLRGTKGKLRQEDMQALDMSFEMCQLWACCPKSMLQPKRGTQ